MIKIASSKKSRRKKVKYPELFGTVSIMSGAIHDADSIAQQRQEIFQNIFCGNREYFQANSPWILAEKNADVIRSKVTVRIIVGGEDRLLQRNRNYHELLSRLEIPHQNIRFDFHFQIEIETNSKWQKE